MTPLVTTAVVLGSVLIGALVGMALASARERRRREREVQAAQDDASRILARAREESQSALRAAELEGKDQVIRLRTSLPGIAIVQDAHVLEMVGNAAEDTKGPRFVVRKSTISGP